jgi:glycosidase
MKRKSWWSALVASLPIVVLPMAIAACGEAPREDLATVVETEDPYQPMPYVQIQHPEWSRSATLYQLNTRQFTPEGTFRAAEAQLPRLKELGADIVWLMPIHPIGEKNRKGSLGSPYSVRDYYGVNPEFGTLEDLRSFIETAHGLGMHVILDWVANHTAWDNPLVEEHPDWYDRDYKGDYRPTPWWDWSDIIDLDYDRPEVRRYMTEAMAWWVREVGVDGFRCDVAGFVPVDFWNRVRVELEDIRPVFMLAEWESRDLHAHAFDATYAWSWNDAMHGIAHGTRDVNALYVYYSWNEGAYPEGAMRMTFVSNHDKNAWEGTQFERFGDALYPTIALSVVGEGIPMIYSGQEAGNPKRLEFFERDPIEWRDHPVGDLYERLFALKHENSALWNAPWGARMIKVPNDAESKVLSFVRANDRDGVFAVFNLSPEARDVRLREELYFGSYTDAFTGEPIEFSEPTTLSLDPWEYRIWLVASPPRS